MILSHDFGRQFIFASFGQLYKELADDNTTLIKHEPSIIP